MLPDKVRKRDGRVEDFEEMKVIASIKKALTATNTKYSVDLLYDLLEARYLTRLKKSTISVEKLQDYIEQALMKEELYDAARAYINYRYQRQIFRETANATNKALEKYVEKEDWRVNENSNLTYSYPAMQKHLVGAILTNYTLTSIYPKNISDAHMSGDIHIHDLSMGTAPYCAAHSLMSLLAEGFGGVEGKLQSKPPSHLASAIDQLVNFLCVLQNEWSGAQAINSFDTLLAPFVKYEHLSAEDVRKCIQNFVYGVNTPLRGGESLFSNVSLDFKVPDDLKDQAAVVGGVPQPFTYGDCQTEVELIDEVFLKVMVEGDANQLPFTFPVVTVGITKEFDYESNIAKVLFDAAARYGTTYFQNFTSSGLNPSDIRSLCCRLSLSMAEMRKHVGGIFGSKDSSGSIGVVTINMSRLGYLYKTEEDLFANLEKLMLLAKDSLELKRKVVTENLKKGLFPYTQHYLGSFKNHFSTIGPIAVHEMCLNFLGKGIDSSEGKDLSLRILKFMRSLIEQFTEETGNLYNLEGVPGESTMYRLALLDKKKFKDIKTSGEDIPYYTSNTFLPVDYTADIIEALDHQEEFQCLYSGGVVFHAFIGEKITGEGAKMLVKMICEKYKIPYFSLTPTFSICPDHKYLVGNHPTCPTCKKECLVYSRIVGYSRPTRGWHVGKQAEFKNRVTYKL